MQFVLVQILQWILRSLLFLFPLILTCVLVVLMVPVRYRAEGEVRENMLTVKGKVTWFFCLVWMRFLYDEKFRIKLRLFGICIWDSEKRADKNKDETKTTKPEKTTKLTKTENSFLPEGETEKKNKTKSQWKEKLLRVFKKLQDIFRSLQEGKRSFLHYIELWKKEETQITFKRAKRKLRKVVKAVAPKKWNIDGEIGFQDPADTGWLMGALASLYPFLGNKVCLVPDFETEKRNIKGKVKGHIRLGNLFYQMVSLILNQHCFKFIRLVFHELEGSNK